MQPTNKHTNISGLKRVEREDEQVDRYPFRTKKLLTGVAHHVLQTQHQAGGLAGRPLIPAGIGADLITRGRIGYKVRELAQQNKDRLNAMFQRYENIDELLDDDLAIVLSELKKMTEILMPGMTLPKAKYFLIAVIQCLNKCRNRPEGSPELETLKKIAVQIFQSQKIDPG